MWEATEGMASGNGDIAAVIAMDTLVVNRRSSEDAGKAGRVMLW